MDKVEQRIYPHEMADIYFYRLGFKSLAHVKQILRYFEDVPGKYSISTLLYWREVVDTLSRKIDFRNANRRLPRPMKTAVHTDIIRGRVLQ